MIAASAASARDVPTAIAVVLFVTSVATAANDVAFPAIRAAVSVLNSVPMLLRFAGTPRDGKHLGGTAL